MRRVTRGLGCAVLAGALVLGAAPTLGAGEAEDPDDVAGRLDLRKLRAEQNDGGILRARLSTYEAWSKRVLRRGGPNRLVVLFDTDPGSPGPEYRGRIVKANRKLILMIKGQGSQFEPLPVRRPNRRTVRFVVPGGSPPNPEGVRIAARSRFFRAGTACDPACIDRIPNGGWVAT